MTTQRLGVIGVGYVGLVTATCFAQSGHELVCLDIDEAKLERLRAGHAPIHEPGVEELAAHRSRLTFTSSAAELFERAQIAFVCVDTPPSASGDADLSRVEAVIGAIPPGTCDSVLVMKSTVPPGTGARLRRSPDERGLPGVAYASNPSSCGYHFQLLSAVIEVNELQKRRAVAKLKRHLGSLRDRRVALWGLAFKPDTDDMREASSVVLAARLIAEGADVAGYDPVVSPRQAASVLPRGIELCESALEAARGADAVVIVTEWPEFVAPFGDGTLLSAMRTPLVIDGRNQLDPEAVRAAGFVYEGVGRAA